MVKKGDAKKVQEVVTMMPSVKAPVCRGDEIGRVVYTLDGKELGYARIIASEDVGKMTFFELFEKIVCTFLHLA